MSGSSLAPIVIPIAVAIGLAAWLIMVYHADRHPYWRGQIAAPERPKAGPAGWADRRLNVPQRDARPAELADNPLAPGPRHASGPDVPHAA